MRDVRHIAERRDHLILEEKRKQAKATAAAAAAEEQQPLPAPEDVTGGAQAATGEEAAGES